MAAEGRFDQGVPMMNWWAEKAPWYTSHRPLLLLPPPRQWAIRALQGHWHEMLPRRKSYIKSLLFCWSQACTTPKFHMITHVKGYRFSFHDRVEPPRCREIQRFRCAPRFLRWRARFDRSTGLMQRSPRHHRALQRMGAATHAPHEHDAPWGADLYFISPLEITPIISPMLTGAA